MLAVSPYALSAVLAIAVAAEDAATLPESDQRVRLADRRRFGVPDERTADAICYSIWAHRRAMNDEVLSWNRAEGYRAWDREVQWRSDCWLMLSRALSPNGGVYYILGEWEPDPTRRRLWALNRLRELIGDRAFFGGVMPSPFPQYRIRP